MLDAALDGNSWPQLWDKVAKIQWSGFSREELASIKVPILIIVGDRDFVRVEHAVEIFKAIPSSELAVIPDAGHFALYSEPERVIPVVQHFLEKPAKRSPVAIATAAAQLIRRGSSDCFTLQSPAQRSLSARYHPDVESASMRAAAAERTA